MYDKSIISLKLFDPCYCGDLCANCYKFSVDYDSNEWTELNAYYAGFVCGYNGGKDSENPYKPSGHERDTTYEDRLHFRCMLDSQMAKKSDQIENHIVSYANGK